MRGVPYFNFPAFFEAEEFLVGLGHQVFNPARRDEEQYGKEVSNSPDGNLADIEGISFSIREALAADTRYICLEAEAIALLPQWEDSKGAVAERALSNALGHKILYLHKIEGNWNLLGS